jgi:hypothetical protein
VASLCEKHTLPENQGLSWEEIELNRLSATGITETTIMENWQEITDTMRTITPTMTGITTLVTDRAYARISKNVVAQIGQLAQQAIERKKDLDGIATIDGATNSYPGGGSTMTSGVISAAQRNITGNTTEGADGEINAVLHPFQIHDIQSELVSFIDATPTVEVTVGETAKAYRNGWSGRLFGVNIHEDANIPIVSNNAKGGIFARKGLLYVQGRAARWITKRRDEIGGGAEQLIGYDEYAYGERTPNGVSCFMWELHSDATAPTG